MTIDMLDRSLAIRLATSDRGPHLGEVMGCVREYGGQAQARDTILVL